MLSITGLLDLVGHALGETDAEHAQQVAIGGLAVSEGLDVCLDNNATIRYSPLFVKEQYTLEK